MMKTRDITQWLKGELRGCVSAGEVDWIKRILMEEVLHYTPVDEVIRADFEQPEFVVKRLRAMVSRLGAGEPIQYVIGKATFHGHEFKVTRSTLIPRPETEQLVDVIVDQWGDATDLRVLDLGTGSGCIAISLALALRWAEVDAVDISADALAVAHENAVALKAKVRFVEADMLKLSAPQNEYDIIVSNPPYVCESERVEMERQVLDYEPGSALFVPDSDPLVFYRAITKFAAQALKPGGKLYLEINRRFPEQVCQLATSASLTDARVFIDRYGSPRFVICQTKE